MAYATYTTRAIVCGSKDSYTSDRSFLLFTEAAGMVWVSARSVRVEKSKQRYALQDFSTLRASLIKGKTGWKIGSAEALGNPFLAARERSSRALATYIIRQLRRYLHGEEPVRAVFADVWQLSEADTHFTAEEIPKVQSIFKLRLLRTLGYVNPIPELQPLLEANNISSALPYLTPVLEKQIDAITKTAETVSHL